jgi:hypothetical protein
MSRILDHLVFVSVLCAAVFAATAPQHAKAQRAAPKPVPAQPQPAPVAQATPLPELTPEQGPSSPPEVHFQDGRLTILARNSTMGDVLNAVRQKTGAAVDMPAVSSERVVGQFGPGAPRDVIAQLLNGSHYDYVLVGSPADPGALNKIVLMAKASGPEPVHPAQPNNQPPDENLQAVPEVDSETSDDTASDNVSQPDTQPTEEEPQADQSDQQQNAPAVKTPEQLLRELQQQQQQQQQNMSGPPGAPGQPPQ